MNLVLKKNSVFNPKSKRLSNIYVTKLLFIYNEHSKEIQNVLGRKK